ncbi:imelysin family protein [Thalassobaculum sp. OXR-137]|uniref:imelysin family protein n=1 Tax=Thalassobaculum sp. OXR-137 TaxID=3100173 RepID=UPI002AC981B4|nr:imelysin family protein [Thalassobaculum sp. OXR-137]WPZ36060.1 imelysin family protein [Thalassobaculum sp. OXR-137]
MRRMMLAGLLALGVAPVSAQAAAPSAEAVLKTYADIAHAGYEDSLITAKRLETAVDALIALPSEKTLNDAKSAWRAARVPYQQTEAFRFGNPIVDEWEGKVNAWPLDEGLIDYVDSGKYGKSSDDNPYYTANIVANPTLKLGGRTLETPKITTAVIQELHELDAVEANVTTGYHAIEFLLWGQDLNGTGPGAGNRPYTDFDTKNCTNGNCDRRAAYLEVATDLLIADLEEMVANWDEGGAARTQLMEAGDKGGLAMILTGMGSLSYGELAGERMKLGLLLHDPEEEHDCFSDNTHWSHYYDAQGVKNVYEGRYERVDGSVVEGASVSDLVAATDADLDKAITGALNDTMAKMGKMADAAEAGEAYDQQIGEGNEAGNARVDAAITALLVQTREIERAVAALGLENLSIEGSDSLDNPAAVFQ